MARNGSFELVRVFSMLLMIWNHFNQEGFRHFRSGTTPEFAWYLTQALFLLGINYLPAVTGYFGITSSRLNLCRLLTIFVQVEFYSQVGYWIGVRVGVVNPKDSKSWYLMHFPLLSDIYWYASAYLTMVWFTPGINFVARNLSRVQYLIAIIGVLVLEFNDCRGSREGRLFPSLATTGSVHLAFLYFIAGYFRLHSRLLPWIVILVLFCLCLRIMYSVRRNTDFYRKWFEAHGLGFWKCHLSGNIYIRPMDVISIICSALSLCVCAGLWLPAPVGTACTWLGSLSFASYLIHFHPIWAWKLGNWWFRLPESIAIPEMAMLNGYRSVISVFAFCVLIDLYRHYCWETGATVVSICRGWLAKWHTGNKQS